MALMSPEDQLRMTMGAQPAQLGMIQHPMHAVMAPIGPAPPELSPDVSGMAPDYEMEQDKNAGMSATSPKQPKVTTMSPVQRYEERLAQKQMSDLDKDANPYGSESNHPGFFGKFLHGLSVATGGPNRRLMAEGERNNQIQGIEKSQAEQAQQQAQTQQTQAHTGQIEQQTAAATPVEISPEQADELESPELAGTKVAPAVLATLYKQRGINQQRIETNQNTVQGRKDVANIQALSREQLQQLKPEQRDDKAIRLNQQLAEGKPLSEQDASYLKAYQKYINDTKIVPGVARAQAFGQFRPLQVVDPETGTTHYEYSGNAIAHGSQGTGSIPFRTAAGMAKFMTSGKGGQTITAYNTANDHLDLLGKAADALGNGDVQAINALNNSFQQQFGHAAPTNFNAVKAMLAGELANVAKVTGATDPEIAEQKDNINRASSPEQIRGFIDTNHDLMDQKAYEMYQQYQQGIQGQPAFHTGLSGHQPAGGGAQPKVLKFNPGTGRLE